MGLKIEINHCKTVIINSWNKNRTIATCIFKKLLFKFKGHQNPVLLFALRAQVSEESWSEQR